MSKHRFLLVICCFAFLAILVTGCEQKHVREPNLLVFHKTEKFHHKSIADGIAALQKMAVAKHFRVTFSENSSLFTPRNLAQFDVIMFLNTTGNILNDSQQNAMEGFIRKGGGFVGVHAAADTEWRGSWLWYRGLVGAVFQSHPKHPNVQEGVLHIIKQDNIATHSLPSPHKRFDEWYNFRDYTDRQTVLITVDENSYKGGTMGAYHPVSWYQNYDGGRSFYTAMGHTKESYQDPYFLDHLWGGLQYAFGNIKD